MSAQVPTLPLISVNGHLTDQINAIDRGLAYGDGLFETVRIDDQGNTPLWGLHYQRLERSLRRLKINVSRDWMQGLEARIAHLIEIGFQSDRRPSQGCVLKIIVTRGVGGRGYQLPHESAQPSDILQLMPYPSLPSEVHLCEVPVRLSRNPVLAGMKHLNKLEYVLAAEAALASREPLLLDTEGWVVESLSKNLVIECHGQLITPPLALAGVAGVQRAALIEALGGEVIERALGLNDFLSASAVVSTNALVGMLPVKSYASVREGKLDKVTQFEQSDALCHTLRSRLSRVETSPWAKRWL